MKTNKSMQKRLRVTKRGKVLSRKAGQGHFNAKERRSKQLQGRKQKHVVIRFKTLSNLLPAGSNTL